MINKKTRGSFLFILGFILSPLSWWNDIFINIPLSYIFSFPFSLISEKLFLPSFVFGYFLTNLLGFLLMHIGVNDYKYIKYKKNLKKDILIALGYTLLIILLVLIGVIKAPTEYLS